MTTNEVKIMLIEVRRAEQAYRQARDKAERFRLTLTGGKSIRYDRDSSTCVKDSNPIERACCQLADYDAEADRLLDELIQKRKSAAYLISRISDEKQREIIKKRYIYAMSWEDIAFEMNYSVRWVQKLHGYALKKISKNS